MSYDDPTPTDVVRSLGVYECVSSLVALAQQNPQNSVLTGIIELAMAIGARGMCRYIDHTPDPDVVAQLRKRMNFWKDQY